MKRNCFFTLVLASWLTLFASAAHAVNPCALTTNSMDNGTGTGGIGGTGISQESGIGGTGHSLEGGVGGTGHGIDNGVGGTGQTAQGVGGTGKQLNNGVGGTGQRLAVIGVVTGFASVCVNGVEVHYDNNTNISINGETASAKQLSIGQVVSISAEVSTKGWNASRIVTNDAVAGPVSKFLAPNRVEVLGQTVHLSNELTQAMSRDKITVGQSMRVQGVRMANGEILATSASRAPSDRVVLSGTVTPQAGAIGIGGVKVNNLNGANPKPGQVLSVTGRMVGNTLQASNIRSALPVDPNAQQLSIQSSVASVGVGKIQLSNGLVVNSTASTKVGNLVYVTAKKDQSGHWQTTQVSNQTHADLMRRAGQREDNSGKGSSSKKRGKQDDIEDNADNSNDNDENSNSGSSDDESNSNSGSSKSGSSNLGSNESNDDNDDSGSSNSGSSNSGSSNSGSSNSGSSNSGSSNSGSSNSGSSNSGSSNSGSSNSGSSNSGSSNSGSSNSGSSNSGSSNSGSSRSSNESSSQSRVIQSTENLRVEKLDKVDHTNKVDKIDRIEKVDKVDRVDKVERVDKVDRVEKVEKVDRVEKIERVEKVDRVEKVEKVEKIDKVERVDRTTVDDRGGSGKGRNR